MAQSSGAQRRIGIDPDAVIRVEVFLVSAVVTVLLTRGFLAAAGFPQVGGGGLHIAHVLWGGLLMALALVSATLRPGSHSQAHSMVLGGVGFGLFIDEVGKFVTSDTNYFFRPAVAIMYSVFVLFVVGVREAAHRHPPTDATRLALAATAAADHFAGQLNARERRAALDRLSVVQTDPVAVRLLSELLRTGPAAGKDSRTIAGVIAELRQQVVSTIGRVAARPIAARSALALLAASAAYTLVGAVYGAVGPTTPATLASLTVTVLSSAATLIGTTKVLRHHLLDGLSWLRTGLLLNLLISDLIQFVDQQFAALIGVVVNLVLLIAVTGVAQAQPREGA